MSKIIGPVIIEIDGDSIKLIKATDKAASALMVLNRRARTIGRDLTRYVTMPLLAMGGAAVAASVDFREAFGEIQETLGRTVREAISPAVSVVRSLAGWFVTLDANLRNGAVAIAAFAAALGPLLSMFSRMLPLLFTLVGVGMPTGLPVLATVATAAGVAFLFLARRGKIVEEQLSRIARAGKDAKQELQRLRELEGIRPELVAAPTPAEWVENLRLQREFERQKALIATWPEQFLPIPAAKAPGGRAGRWPAGVPEDFLQQLARNFGPEAAQKVDPLGEHLAKIRDIFEEVTARVDAWGRSIASQFAQATVAGQLLKMRLGDAFKAIIADLIQMILYFKVFRGLALKLGSELGIRFAAGEAGPTVVTETGTGLQPTGFSPFQVRINNQASGLVSVEAQQSPGGDLDVYIKSALSRASASGWLDGLLRQYGVGSKSQRR